MSILLHTLLNFDDKRVFTLTLILLYTIIFYNDLAHLKKD